MIERGSPAPEFRLESHLGGLVGPADFRGRRNLLVVFYPLDWTGT